MIRCKIEYFFNSNYYFKNIKFNKMIKNDSRNPLYKKLIIKKCAYTFF